MQVEVLQWPEEEQRRQSLARAGQPRLLVVEPEASPPSTPDTLEDWIRLPAPDTDVDARIAALGKAGRSVNAVPQLDDDGLLHCRDRWVAVPPVEARLVNALLDRFGAVVSRDDLTLAGWGSNATSRNSLDVHMLRLRRRLGELGLKIRTVRSRGYLLEHATQ